MKTEQIYMLDPYKNAMDAVILEVQPESDGFRVVLDQTVFYPMGGGQPTDQGCLKLEDGRQVDVYQVMIKDGEIWHYLKAGIKPEVGQKVHGEIDWNRRFKNMQVHTGGHIIDFAMFMLGFTPNTLMPQKGDHGKKPFIVYAGALDQDIKDLLQEKVNELISQNLKFSWEFKALDDLKSEALYLQPGLPSNKPLRILRLEGVGSVADGGTICATTSEVGNVQITNIETKEGNTIVSYAVQ